MIAAILLAGGQTEAEQYTRLLKEVDLGLLKRALTQTPELLADAVETVERQGQDETTIFTKED